MIANKGKYYSYLPLKQKKGTHTHIVMQVCVLCGYQSKDLTGVFEASGISSI